MGEITGLRLPNDLPIGENYYSAPKVLVSGSGEGAKITAEIGRNIENDEYGKIIGFDISEGGSGYIASQTSIIIVPTIQTVVPGEEVHVSWDPGIIIPTPVKFSLLGFYIGSDLSLALNKGWLCGLASLFRYLSTRGKVELEDPQPGATTSKVEIFAYETEEAEEASFPPSIREALVMHQYFLK